MTTQTHVEQIIHRWYMRPAFFVDRAEREIVHHSIPSRESWWGYDAMCAPLAHTRSCNVRVSLPLSLLIK
jgi:hypothetical protein